MTERLIFGRCVRLGFIAGEIWGLCYGRGMGFAGEILVFNAGEGGFAGEACLAPGLPCVETDH